MGNCVSAWGISIAPTTIRVVQASEGRVVDVELPSLQSSMTVAELMLEFPPAHFVAQLHMSDVLASTSKRAAALGADADVKPGAAYVLFPMARLHTRINPQELLSFAKLLHPQDRQFIEATHNSFKIYVKHGLFTARARVAPLGEEKGKDAQLHITGAGTQEQACQLPSSFRKQPSDQESLSDAFSSRYSCISSSCGDHMGVIRPKPWAPKLHTIMENS